MIIFLHYKCLRFCSPREIREINRSQTFLVLQYYDQIDGVAMGSSLGPTLAGIFMSDLENKVFDTFDGNLPLFYKR